SWICSGEHASPYRGARGNHGVLMWPRRPRPVLTWTRRSPYWVILV
ncbi:hypothetical protein A2U01_0070011, partial [Trifolium medium]|nr:hypothetical protein [Trifolium medium]